MIVPNALRNTMITAASFAVIALFSACSGNDTKAQNTPTPTPMPSTSPTPMPKVSHFYSGVDLSYVNEMLDCGAQYRQGGEIVDPYTLFSDAGANYTRVRLWFDPDWTQYSDYEDVKLTIQRARDAGMKVLLDFHYSDTWADPEKQYIPSAWLSLYGDTEALADTLYDYTIGTLRNLDAEGLLPDMVQVGNETNHEILQPENTMDTGPINWDRNATLLNHGLQAVADFNAEKGVSIARVLHIAQPENALWWFDEATTAGVTDFEIIGLSYYGKWSVYKLDRLAEAIASLKTDYQKEVVVVETAYPWTMDAADQAANLLNEDSLLEGYPATPEGQLNYLKALVDAIVSGGGNGLFYWEPAWVSTSCSTLWGQGSHWENATFFDAFDGNEALPSMGIFEYMNDFVEQ